MGWSGVRRETIVVVALIAIVLLPMWGLTVATGHNSFEEIAVQPPEGSSIVATGAFLPTPTEVSVYVSGVLSWLGLAAIFGFVVFNAKFIERAGRRGDPQHGSASQLPDVPSFVESESQSIVAYWPAAADLKGLALVALFGFVTVAFATLFATETLAQSRLQYLGLYAALASFSLASLVTCYTTYFLPSIVVAEDREH